MPKLRILIPVCLSLLAVLCCGGGGRPEIALYRVTRGDFFNSITVSGELRAARSQVISAPSLGRGMGQLKIAYIVEDGVRVEQGDTLVLFDNTEVQKNLTEAQNELDIATAELSKARVNHRSELEGLEADLKMAEIGYEVSKLDLEQAGFEADIDRKKIELDLEKAGIDLEQARQEIESRRKVQAEEISKQVLQVEQARTRLDQAREALESLVITAPTPGLAILRESYITREKYQVDDQLWSGWPMIGLPDLTTMEAVVEVNEVDISRVETGLEARVRLDAFPDTAYTGKVTEIATLARNKERGSRVKVFETTVRIEGSEERLMPGMTVNCEIIVDRVPDVVFIPLEALFTDEDGGSVVYVEDGFGFEKRNVSAGMQNDNYVVIEEGLEQGEQVALVDPTLLEEEEEENGGQDAAAGGGGQ